MFFGNIAILLLLLLLLLFRCAFCRWETERVAGKNKIGYNNRHTVSEEENEYFSALLLEEMNEELILMNRETADLEWRGATNPTEEAAEMNTKMARVRSIWRNGWCSRRWYSGMGPRGKRMLRLLCRGPKYTPCRAEILGGISENLWTSYAFAKVCRREGSKERCYNGEPDLERLMKTSRNESELRWAWESWRDEMSKVKDLYTASVALQNLGARDNGYHDLGECWREELETPDLEELVDDLYRRVEPLYRLLHAVIRFRLAEKYPGIVGTKGPIPAHLLGNMWSQNWETLVDLLLSPKSNFASNVTKALERKNYTVRAMVKKAEDFYVSLGFPPMTRTFWSKSIFEKQNRTSVNCHGTAANMYRDNDFRILACLEVRAEDFYVIHHEMGHIHYYMAYAEQPAIFRAGANSAFHEAIGDAVMYGVVTPQHLQRLGLIEDSILTDDLTFLLKQALGKLPQLPHALVMDKWRWDVFAGKIRESEYNRAWWELSRRYMGIAPPSPRSEDFFDPAAKFHVMDNAPYIRYFLGYILQMQLFKGMCEASVTGKVGNLEFDLPLHRCDIYGSKDAGKRLMALMKLGSSVNWKDALRVATGSSNYKVEPLLEYFQLLYEWLKFEVDRYDIPTGWD